MLKILLSGCNGKMGQVVNDLVKDSDEFTICCGFDKNISTNFKVPVFTKLEDINEIPDIIIDFSIPIATLNILDFAIKNNIPMVIATTGFSSSQEEIIFNETLNVEQGVISGWNLENLNVSKIKEQINTIYTIEIYNHTGEKLTDEQRAGTGSIIRLVDENGIIKMEYKIVIYGDVSGDGKINSMDLLVLQRHILEIEKLKGIFMQAGNINKNGKNPSSLDSLIIQRHILGLKEIEQ